jgi:cytochrome c biogenesis protein CcmG/thiol:disulfide interchange protein DsbE
MKTDRIIEAGIVVMLLAFVGTLYLSLHETVVNAGDRAPDFSIQTDTGKTVTAHNFGGKLLILNFWATWCQPCIHEVPSLNRLESVLGSKGLVVLGVSQDTDVQAYKSFLARFKVSYLTAREPDQTVKSKYGTILIPESYLIDQSGKVVEKIISDTDWSSEQMIQHVQSLL